MNLFKSLYTEILKTKRTAAFYFTIAAAAFGPFMSMLDLIFDGVENDHRTNILNEIFTTKYQMTGAVVFPIFLILVTTLLPQIEYRNNAWKQVLTSPQSRSTVFFAKFFNIHLLILLFLFANQFFMLVDAVILHFREPALHVLNQPLDEGKMMRILGRSYVAMLALGTLQFWLGLRFKSFIIPVGIGMSLWFCGSLVVMQAYPGFGTYFPYSYQVYSSFDQFKPLHPIYFTSLLYAVGFLMLGYFDFKRKRIHA